MEELRLDKWGYEVNTRSDSCLSDINAYYHQVPFFFLFQTEVCGFVFGPLEM